MSRVPVDAELLAEVQKAIVEVADTLAAIVADAAPSLPPARLVAEDRSTTFTMRLRLSTLAAIEARAKADGATLKQIICRALADAGVEVAPADLEDGTPRRRAAA